MKFPGVHANRKFLAYTSRNEIMLFLWREPTVNMFSFSRGCHVAFGRARRPLAYAYIHGR